MISTFFSSYLIFSLVLKSLPILHVYRLCYPTCFSLEKKSENPRNFCMHYPFLFYLKYKASILHCVYLSENLLQMLSQWGWSLSQVTLEVFLSRHSPNISTNPSRQWGFQQCLPFSWTTLRGKHCRHPIAVMGVVDTFGHGLMLSYPCLLYSQKSKHFSFVSQKKGVIMSGPDHLCNKQPSFKVKSEIYVGFLVYSRK